MNTTACVWLLAATISTGALAAPPAPLSDKERIDVLIRHNLLLTEEIGKLRELAERPRTAEELFAQCMQATKGQGAMAASSVGDQCARILKK